MLGLLKKKTKKDEQNAWVVIFRRPTYNVILMKLKAAVGADASVHHV